MSSADPHTSLHPSMHRCTRQRLWATRRTPTGHHRLVPVRKWSSKSCARPRQSPPLPGPLTHRGIVCAQVSSSPPLAPARVLAGEFLAACRFHWCRLRGRPSGLARAASVAWPASVASVACGGATGEISAAHSSSRVSPPAWGPEGWCSPESVARPLLATGDARLCVWGGRRVRSRPRFYSGS